eukprot:Rmarinus@m.17307
MGSGQSTLLYEEAEELAKGTHFTPEEITRLYSRFQRLDRDEDGRLHTDELVYVPEVAMNPVASRIYDICDGVNFREFVNLLSPFSPDAPVEEKLQFLFRVYDVDGDGEVSESDLSHVITLMVGSYVSSDDVASIAQRTIQPYDSRHVQRLNFSDFCDAMRDSDILKKAMSVRIPLQGE